MDIRAVAIDVDGTLTDKDRRLELGAVIKVRQLEENGIKVIIATGNILCVSEVVAMLIGATGPIISENGGIIKDQKSKEIFILGDCEKIQGAYDFVQKDLPIRKVYRSEHRKTEICIYRDVPVEEIKERLMDFNVEVVDTKYAIHIKDPNLSKGRALERVAKILKIPIETIAAIGDSENDRDMIARSGYGISVGEPSLRDVADFVTNETYGSGTEKAVEKILSLIGFEESK